MVSGADAAALAERGTPEVELVDKHQNRESSEEAPSMSVSVDDEVADVSNNTSSGNSLLSMQAVLKGKNEILPVSDGIRISQGFDRAEVIEKGNTVESKLLDELPANFSSEVNRIVENSSVSDELGAPPSVKPDQDSVEMKERNSKHIELCDSEIADDRSFKRKTPQSKSIHAVEDYVSEDSLEPPKKKRGRPCNNIDKVGMHSKNHAADKPKLSRQNSNFSIEKSNTIKSKAKVPLSGPNRMRGRKQNANANTAQERRRSKDRALLPEVFSCERDAARAFSAIRYMVNITQGGVSHMHRFLKNEEAPSTKHLANIPMPLTSEISVCLDILEAKSLYTWRQLTELRREEKVIQGIGTEISIEQKERNIIEDVLSYTIDTVIGRAARDSEKELCSATLSEAIRDNEREHDSTALSEAILKCLQQNQARIDEAKISLNLIDRRDAQPVNRAFIVSLIKRNSSMLQKNRASMISEIRKRKLGKRNAWEVLGNKYLTIKHNYEGSLSVEEEQEDIDYRLRGGRALASSRFSARIGSGGIVRGEGARVDFDGDRLMHQLYLRETLEMRTTKGKADIPDMESPWIDPDLRRNIAEPNSLENSVETLPIFRGRASDVVDLSGSRITTDGKRQICSLISLNDPCPRGCNCARQVEIDGRRERPWTDIEKCVFLDKFMQYPKNFPKISSFLSNRDTKECIKFYYDSKARIQYKSLLREFDNRRRNQRNAWTFTTAVADSLGAGVYLTDETQEREPVVELPVDDLR